MLLPCYNEDSLFFCLKQFDRELITISRLKFDQTKESKVKPNIINSLLYEEKIIKYIVLCTYGEDLRHKIQQEGEQTVQSKNYSFNEKSNNQEIQRKNVPKVTNEVIENFFLDNPLEIFTRHKMFKVETKKLGELEVRIRNFNSNDKEFIDLIRNEYKILSWYYQEVNQRYFQRCPISYQYRTFPQNLNENSRFDYPLQIFDV